ncbi:AMP-binding protein [Streptomyces prasinus]
MPFTSRLPPVHIPAVSVFDYLFADLTVAERRQPVFVSKDGVTLHYGELVDQIEAFAGALAADGVGEGDVVALYAPNSPEFAVAFHGILRAGATATTVNALYTPGEVVKQLQASGAVTLVTVAAFAGPLLPELGRAGLTSEDAITLDESSGLRTLDSLLAKRLPPPRLSFDPRAHVAVLPYSSGTTGTPKGVRLTHVNLVANVAQAAPMQRITSADTLLAVMPFFHIYGLTVLLNSALRARARLAVLPRFDLTDFLATIQATRCTYVALAPPIAVALAKHPLVDDYDLSSVDTIMSGAAPLDGQLADAVAERIGCTVGQGYGMSEMSPVSHCTARDDHRAPRGSVGQTLPNMQCKIVDPSTGDEVDYPHGTGVSAPGELWCQGPNVMAGYLDNDVATAQTIDAEGYLRTGDIATVDADGYVTIVDRLKELIKYKGYQVPPAELEAVLLTHPGIADGAVIGDRDADGEEIPKAFVVRQTGVDLTAEDVITFVAQRVAPYKKIRAVEFIDAIPKSSAGKILRRELRH